MLIDGPNHGGSPPVRRPVTLKDCVGAAAHPDRCRSLAALYLAADPGAVAEPLTDPQVVVAWHGTQESSPTG